MVRQIKNEQQYEETLMRVYALLQKDLTPDSTESDELEILSILVKEYEDAHYALTRSNPPEAILISEKK